MDRMLGIIAILVIGSSTAQAGLTFTDQTAFNAAAASLQPSWSEDFEGFSLGEVPDPLTIGHGDAIYTDGTVTNSRSNIKNNLATNHDLEGPPDGLPSIGGIGNTSLNVAALSLGFGNLFPIIWAFDTTLGTDLSPEFLGNDGLPVTFIGWVSSSPDENLISLRAVGTKGINGNIIDIDNIQAFDPTSRTIPEPTTLALLGIGFAGLAWRRRRP